MTSEKFCKAKSLWQSFDYAAAGFRKAFCAERNLRIHLLLTLGVVAVGYNCDLGPGQWAVLILTIGMMLATELMNTALEHLGEAVSDGAYSETVRSAKDIAAAACLVVAVMAIVIGVLVFWPAASHYLEAFNAPTH